ncbi:MAG: sulfatase [Deltaproteobacteria bacterium]|nr:sulfatase [Deltaproteobacteria bacterium]
MTTPAIKLILTLATLGLLLAGCRDREPRAEALPREHRAEQEPRPVVKRGTPRSDAPNLILVVLDTVRRDHLSTYGYGRETSPSLTRIAARGAKFTRASSAADWTHPSHASMLTGTYPSLHGARFAGPSGKSTDPILRLRRDVPTLPELLAAAGYTSVASVGAPVLSRGLGVTRGFDAFEGATPAAEPSAALVNDRLFALLDRQTAPGPRFVLVNYFDAHDPYVARPEHAPWINPKTMTRQVALAGLIDRLPRFARIAAGLETLEPSVRAAAVDNYDSEIAQADAALAKLLDGLEARGMLKNALVAVVADHGELFGEHGLYSHGLVLWREVLDVPLVLVGAGVTAGLTVDEPVETVDLLATFLAAAGAPFPPTNLGSSLLPLAGAVGSYRRHPLVAEAFANPTLVRDVKAYSTDYRSLMSGARKLIVSSSGAKQLFDLAVDPSESHDLSSSEPTLVTELSAILDSWPPGRAVGPGAPVSLTKDEEKRLKALGYLQ